MKRYSSYLLTGLLALSMSGYAKTKKQNPAKMQPVEEVPAPEVKSALLDDALYANFVSDVKKSPKGRASANVDVPAIEKNFSSDFIDMRDELIGNKTKNIRGVTSVEELDEVINKYSSADNYNKLSPQAKFVALQLRALKPFKGIIFRAKLYIGEIAATRTMIVTALRAQIAGIQAFFPVGGDASVNHWEIVFRYLIEDVPGVGFEIKTDDDLYKAFKQINADLGYVTNDLAALVETTNSIWWDNKLFMSFASFASEKDRYIMLGKPELWAIYSAAMANQSMMTSSTAYSFTGLRSSIKSVGQMFGVDTGAIAGAINFMADGAGPQGMSSYSRTAVLNKHAQLGVLMPDGKARMERAYQMLLIAVRAAKISYEETKKLPEGAENLFDSRVANAFSRIGNQSFANIDQMLDEKEPVKSAVVSGERIKVTLKNFYMNPPGHLKELYPTKWEMGVKSRRAKNAPHFDKDGQVVRNYKYGMATEWNLAPYQKIFPEITGQGGRTADVPKYVRILSQTWGSSVFAIPLSAAIF